MFAELSITKNNFYAYQCPQDESLFSLLPDEIQIIIFQKLGLPDLAHAALACKQWKDLTQDPAIWQNLANQIGLKLIGINPKNEFRFVFQLRQQHRSEEIFSKNLGEEVFSKLVQLPDWEGEIDFKYVPAEDESDFKYEPATFHHGYKKVSDIAKIQHVADGQDHFGKKIIGNELVFIFVTANRWHSQVFRFNLAFNPQSLIEDEYLHWTYDFEHSIGFFLSKEDNEQKRNAELSFEWSRLKSEFEEIFKIYPPQCQMPESLQEDALGIYLRRDCLKLNAYLTFTFNE